MASTGNRHCALCVSALWFPVVFCLCKVTSSLQFSGAARGGEASSLWVDVQKLCNMCVLSSSWNFFVSHDNYQTLQIPYALQ